MVACLRQQGIVCLRSYGLKTHMKALIQNIFQRFAAVCVFFLGLLPVIHLNNNKNNDNNDDDGVDIDDGDDDDDGLKVIA